ncbi:hypothetical protein E8E11_007783 [Didymella keratinophila]|nr:hypothetical protein E8E11_007783 [Didymella keratinophila]
MSSPNKMSQNPQDPKSRKRGEPSSDSESSRSPSYLEEAMAALQLEEKLTSKVLLQRYFSASSVISTSSIDATRTQLAIGERSQFRQIGSGTCANVFEVPGAVHVFKAAKHPGKDTDQLWNDYTQHLWIQEVFDRFGRATWKVRNFDRFPKEQNEWTNLLASERIMPIPGPLGEALIEEYCPKTGIEAAKKLESNKHCLLNKMKLNTSTWNAHLENFKTRHIHVWMLDFNRCAKFSTSDLTQLVRSLFINDPYYPRPCPPGHPDRYLWDIFKKTYLDTSTKGLKTVEKDKLLGLPEKFLYMVEKEQQRRDMARQNA